jgi:8-oxo-dGTP diphosphatase
MGSVVVVGAGVVVWEKRVLVARRPKGTGLEGKWEFPGGKQRPGETIESCVRREIHEELGIWVRPIEYICSVDVKKDNGNISLKFYLCEAETIEVNSQEGQEFSWMTVEEIEDIDLLPPDREAFNEIKKEVQRYVQKKDRSEL